MSDAPPRNELAGLEIADSPQRWRALGFVADEAGELVVNGIRLTLGIAAPGGGITAWTLRHLPDAGDIDGLSTRVAAPAREPRGAGPEAAVHPNGAIGIDHVVVMTPEFVRLATILDARGLALRRVRDAGGHRQGFRRLGPAIMEIVEAPEAPATAFWGVTFIVADLARLGRYVGAPRDAVQPGRRIAAVSRDAGLSTRVAFMDPEPR